MELSTQTDYQFRLATEDDCVPVISLLKEVAHWIKEQGIDQWQYLLEDGADKEIVKSILNKDTYVVVKNDEFFGTFTLYSNQNEWDIHIWGDSPSDSIYLHRLAIKPDKMGEGIGKEIFLWIEQNIKANKKYLRLDCVSHNKKLNNFYKKNGFEFVGVSNEHSKFQKLF